MSITPARAAAHDGLGPGAGDGHRRRGQPRRRRRRRCRSSLEVDGRVVETRPLKLEPNGSASVTFEPFAPTAKFTRGTVRLGDDRLIRDNAFHFVVSPPQRVKVVIVERPGASRAASLYLAQALALGEAPAFDVRSAADGAA